MIELLRHGLEAYTTWILFGGVFLLLAFRAPIAVALGLPSLLVVFIESGQVTAVVTHVIATMQNKFLLTAIPFFILSSVFLTSGGAARKIVQFAITTMGHFRGGLGIAGVFSCMQFAALSGSSPATVAAVGPIAIDAMEKANYPKRLAAGIIATAGTLGILIPPSIVMVVYAASVNESVGDMFIAGVIPGLLAGLFLMVGIVFAVGKHNVSKASFPGMRQFWKDGYHALFGLLLIVFILVGIYKGVFTPTEAAAFAAVYAFVIATGVYRGMGFLKDEPWLPESSSNKPVSFVVSFVKGILFIVPNVFHPETRTALLEAAKMSVMLMFIIFNAIIFSHVLTEQQIPQQIAAMIADADLKAWQFLLILNILLLIGGQFMEPSGLLLIVAPIMHPIALSLGIDPIHLGIIMVVNMEIGMITPPVGLNLFVTSSITNMNIIDVMKAALPWVAILMVFLGLVTYVPWVSTGLLTLMGA